MIRIEVLKLIEIKIPASDLAWIVYGFESISKHMIFLKRIWIWIQQETLDGIRI